MAAQANGRDMKVSAHGGIRETLDSIIVALILAFVFRAFVVEAFVIPTGSMAPTLYGAHGTLSCEQCGTEFAYGVNDPSDGSRREGVTVSSRAVCPNCNHLNSDLKINDTRRNAETGDRILVLKWPFDIGGSLLGPNRWDVVVFKEASRTPSGRDGETNFIKRLIGLPGEVLMIVDGDVYTVPLDALSQETLAAIDQRRHEKYELREGIRHGRLSPLPEAALAELDKKLTIARKTRVAQRSLWLPVYDHDFPPDNQLTPYQPRWTAGSDSGWDASSRRVRFVDRQQPNDAIELAGKRILARCSYNIFERDPVVRRVVSDLRLRFVLTPHSAAGTVAVHCTKRDDLFIATIGMNGTVTLERENRSSIGSTPPARQVMASRQLDSLTMERPIEVQFENVDYRVSLMIDGEQVLATTSDDPDALTHYAPDLRALRRAYRQKSVFTPPRIHGAGGSFDLSHLAVYRDIYYGRTSSPIAWAPPAGWGTVGNPMMLRAKEYFVLGDNTAASADSRLWSTVGNHLKDRGEAYQLGTVPEDQLIGKAFFVYWPSPHRLEWLPVLSEKWGLVPDVGRMRWIR